MNAVGEDGAEELPAQLDPSDDVAPTTQRARGEPQIFFHIGAPKTGTTFLQRIMWQNRAQLADAGVLYPGETFGAHVQAAFDLRNAGFHGHRDPDVPGAWDAFVEAARGWNGTVIFCQELFSPATRSQVDQAMEDLAFAEIHLVYTARELTRQVPAAWQEDLKNRFPPTLEEFIAALRHKDTDLQGLGRMFWRMQDANEVLARWSRQIDPERVHLITVPQTGGEPDLLWRRFASVVGVDPAAYDISGAFQNTSLGAAEATFLQRLNVRLADEVGWPLYNEMVKHYLAQEVLAQRGSSARIRLPAADVEWFARVGAAQVESLRRSGYDIVGSLDDLLAPDDVALDDEPAGPPAEEQLDVAIEAIAAVLLRVSRLRRGVLRR